MEIEREEKTHTQRNAPKGASVENVFVAIDFIYRFILASSILFRFPLRFDQKLSLRASSVDTKD